MGPAKAMAALPWWNVRLFDGVYYLIDDTTGWRQELDTWEVLSLEEAMEADPEMKMFIHGHSQLESASTEHPAVWNFQARQWLISLQPPSPHDQLALSLDLPLLYLRVGRKQQEEERRWQAWEASRSQKWQPYNWWDWEEPGNGCGSTPSSSQCWLQWAQHFRPGSLKQAAGPSTPSGIIIDTTQGAGVLPSEDGIEGAMNKEGSQSLIISSLKKLSLQKA